MPKTIVNSNKETKGEFKYMATGGEELPPVIRKAIKEQQEIVNEQSMRKMLENCLWMMREHGFKEKEIHTIVRNLYTLTRY